MRRNRFTIVPSAKSQCQESALKCTQHIASSQYVLAVFCFFLTNTWFIIQKQKDRKILSSKIIYADKTAHTNLNLKNRLVRKTISDAEVLNLMQFLNMSPSTMCGTVPK